MGKSGGSTQPSIKSGSGGGGKTKKTKAKMYFSRGGGRGGGHRGRGGQRGGASGGNRGRGPSKFLCVGMKGFLCTTNFREKNAVKEAYNLLNEYCEEEVSAEGGTVGSTVTPTSGQLSSSSNDNLKSSELDPKVDVDSNESDPAKSASLVEPNSQLSWRQNVDDDDDDFESAMKSEIDTLKSDQVRYKFQSVDTGVRNLVFINTTIQDPVGLAHRILGDIISTKQQKSQALLRMIPIETTCRADSTEIKKAAHLLFPKYFKTGFNSFQVIYKCRYNNSMDRGEVIRVVAEAVMEINSFNTVNLNDPKFAIIVEIIKGMCCLSVVTDYNKFRKYNLIEVSVSDPDPSAPTEPVGNLKPETEISAEEGSTAAVEPAAPDIENPTQEENAV